MIESRYNNLNAKQNQGVKLSYQEQNQVDSYLHQSRSPGGQQRNLRNPMYVDFEYQKQKEMTTQQQQSLQKVNSDLQPSSQNTFSQQDLIGNRLNKIPINTSQKNPSYQQNKQKHQQNKQRHQQQEQRHQQQEQEYQPQEQRHQQQEQRYQQQEQRHQPKEQRHQQQKQKHQEQQDQNIFSQQQDNRSQYQQSSHPPRSQQFSSHNPSQANFDQQSKHTQHTQATNQSRQTKQDNQSKYSKQDNQSRNQQDNQSRHQQDNNNNRHQQEVNKRDEKKMNSMSEKHPAAAAEGKSRKEVNREQLRDSQDNQQHTQKTPLSYHQATKKIFGDEQKYVDKNGFMKGQQLKNMGEQAKGYGVYNPVTGGQTYNYKPKYNVKIMTEDIHQVNASILEKFQRNPLKNAGTYTTTAQEVGRYQNDQVQDKSKY